MKHLHSFARRAAAFLLAAVLFTLFGILLVRLTQVALSLIHISEPTRRS